MFSVDDVFGIVELFTVDDIVEVETPLIVDDIFGLVELFTVDDVVVSLLGFTIYNYK